jgi:transposase
MLLNTINNLELRLQIQSKKNEELLSLLKQNSSNSHKPPSSDIYKPPKPKPAFSKTEAEKKIKGGQKGHIGNTMQMVSNPNKYSLVSPEEKICTCCGKPLVTKKLQKTGIKRQVSDIPKMPEIEVTEYERGYIECCGQKYYGQFPSEARTNAQYGNRIKTLVVYLNIVCQLSVGKIVELLQVCYGVEMNEGTVCNIVKSFSAKAQKNYEQIKDLLGEAGIVHLDETSIKVNGGKKWAHTACTKDVTVVYVDDSRSCQAHSNSQGYQPSQDQILIHDCWKPYFSTYPYNEHALCNAHIIRELRAVIENDKSPWANELLEFLLSLYTGTDKGLNTVNNKSYYQKKYEAICEKGNKYEVKATANGKQGVPKQTKARNLLDRMILYKKEILRFAFEENVPFTNNQAERDIRPIKGKQKVATHFRSLEGTQNYLKIHSICSTIKKQGKNIMEILHKILQNPDNIVFNFSG